MLILSAQIFGVVSPPPVWKECRGLSCKSFVLTKMFLSVVQLYTSAINEDDTKDDYFSNRAQAYIKLEDFAGEYNQALFRRMPLSQVVCSMTFYSPIFFSC